MADPGISWGGASTPKVGMLTLFFLAENCMKIKEFGPPESGGWARVPGALLDPPLKWTKNFMPRDRQIVPNCSRG